MIVPSWRQHVCTARVRTMPCLGAFQYCLTNCPSYCSVLSDLLIWITTTVGLWRGGQRHTVGCSGSRSGQQISFSDDCSQQIQVSVPEAEQWCQRQTGCLLSEPPRFSHLRCSLRQVTYCCFVLCCAIHRFNVRVPPFHLLLIHSAFKTAVSLDDRLFYGRPAFLLD